MSNFLYCDTETWSETPLKDGLHKYAEKVEIMIFAYAFNDEPVAVLDLTAGDKIPARVLEAFKDNNTTTVFHNAAFDRTVLRHALKIQLDTKKAHCTMVQALAHALPGGLLPLSQIMGVPVDLAKDSAGKKLINLFCKPRPKNMLLRRATRHSHPPEWKQFLAYAGNDIEAMRVIHKKMPNWNYSGIEKTLWELDQKINDRGFKVDTVLAQSALTAINLEQKKLAKRTQNLTQNIVESASQRDKLLKYILEYYGVQIDDMQKANIERRIEDPELPWAVKELLSVRLETSQTSTSKYKTLLRAVSSDERLRGTLQFDGASRTRRSAGRVFQPQNLPRPTHKQKDIDAGIMAIKLDCVDLIEDNVMSLVSSCIRGCIIAAEGKKLVVSDLSNIEGRVACWITNEEWKLKAFLDYDNGTGFDLYVLAYARAFNVDPSTVTKDQRQLGKVMELALGYGGGVGAFVTFAITYKMDLEDLAVKALETIPDKYLREATGSWEWHIQSKRSVLGLPKNVWIVCESLKRMWRAAHPNFNEGWAKLENCARNAILMEGKEFTYNSLRFIRKGAWLRIILPSGACLCYPSPRVEGMQISYMGMNQYTRKWSRIKTYGGKLFENICQSLARDVMFHNMPNIEDEGYEIILSVHDELLTEAPDCAEWNEKHLSSLLASNPSWAEGLPLAAGGFEAKRYRKG